jgi:hypothetical protein
MRLDTQYYFKVIFKKIADEPGLKPVLNDLDLIPGTQITFICLSTTIFDMLRETHGSHLSVYELRETLNCDFSEATRLFNCMNIKSKNISCEEFQNFLSKGTIDDINDLLSLSEVVENLGIIQENNVIDEPEKNSVIIDEEIEEDTNCIQYIINSVLSRINSGRLK